MQRFEGVGFHYPWEALMQSFPLLRSASAFLIREKYLSIDIKSFSNYKSGLN
jgi:hypothetical protein